MGNRIMVGGHHDVKGLQLFFSGNTSIFVGYMFQKQVTMGLIISMDFYCTVLYHGSQKAINTISQSILQTILCGNQVLAGLFGTQRRQRSSSCCFRHFLSSLILGTRFFCSSVPGSGHKHQGAREAVAGMEAAASWIPRLQP